MSKERPIIFSGAMVRAILDGRKTQTRRIVRGATPSDPVREWLAAGQVLRCPYGESGDTLWVRETWALVPTTAYRASEGVQQTVNPANADKAAVYKEGWTRCHPTGRWRPSIHMPRWASRLTLRITEVRVERVQDISEADAKAEGVTREYNGPRMYPSGRAARTLETHYDAFARLWDTINAKRAPWESNPWVWAITFEVL